jgi:hypothetical protein
MKYDLISSMAESEKEIIVFNVEQSFLKLVVSKAI